MGHSRTRGGREGGPRCCTHLSGSDPTQGGQWGEEEQHDIGGITWQTTSGWGRRRRRRREGDGDDDYGYRGRGIGGDGGGGRGGRRGRGLLDGPCHSN